MIRAILPCLLHPISETHSFSKRIYKQDYTLISPPAKELSSTKYALNPHVKVEIVVANTKELQAERRRIETNIRTQKESEIARYEKIISEKDAELSAMKEKNARYDQLRPNATVWKKS